MKDIRIEKIIPIAIIIDKNNYKINETISRRINNYSFQANTTITHNDKYIKISTETSIKGVNNVLFLFPNGKSNLNLNLTN